jgi:hypothetical protein
VPSSLNARARAPETARRECSTSHTRSSFIHAYRAAMHNIHMRIIYQVIKSCIIYYYILFVFSFRGLGPTLYPVIYYNIYMCIYAAAAAGSIVVSRRNRCKCALLPIYNRGGQREETREPPNIYINKYGKAKMSKKEKGHT